MNAALLALVLAATPPRYGGGLKVLAPASAIDADRLDPADARSPIELALTRVLCEPLFRLGSDGTLQPGLAQLPGDTHTRLLSLKLRAGLQSSGATPLRAKDVAAALDRLASPGNPYRALMLPLSGTVSARSDVELAASFGFAYPDWPLALAHVGACPLPPGKRAPSMGAQTGPFALEGKLAAAGTRLDANVDCPAGRPYADKLNLRSGSAKTAARALASGDADLALLPVPDTAHVVEGPLAVATYFATNPAKPQLAKLASLVASGVDRAELVRIFVRGPAQPLYGLLAPSVEPHPVAATPVNAMPPLAQHLSGTLLVDAGDESRAVAERLQVKLHDLGADLKVVPVARAEYVRRLGVGDYDAALVTLPALPEAGLNLAQVLLLAEPPAQVQQELAVLGALPEAAARREKASARARELAGTISVTPLYAQGLAAAGRPHVRGLAFDAAGVPDLGALWLDDLDAPRATAQKDR
ncbi:MAG: hypothetical protein JST54_16420 [Deltaproteobacteria bacterium]|nr:hypothetical protein [Deltaproteobacteria bacterium]